MPGTFEDIDGEPRNPICIKLDKEYEGYETEYVGNCSKAAVVRRLKEVFGKGIDVPAEKCSLVWEGKSLEDAQTMSENGVVEPGAMARKRGQKLTLHCQFEAGVEPGYLKELVKLENDRLAAEEAARIAAEEKEKLAAEKAEQDKINAELIRIRNLPPREREKLAKLDEESRKRLNDVRSFMSQRNVKKAKFIEDDSEVPRMTEEQIATTLRIHVLDIDTRIAPRSDGKKALDFIVSTYNNGLPNYPEALSKHLAACLRHSLGFIRQQDEAITPGASRRRALCARLADAFEACQAVQARVIEQIAEELQEGPLFEREVKSMVVDFKERTLEGVILKLWPGSASDSVAPGKQLAHIVNQYRQHFGMSGIDHETSDRLAEKATADSITKVTAQFEEDLDILEFVDAFVNDVNQPTGGVKTERRIDRSGFGIWAGTHPEIQHRVYFSNYSEEEQKELYGDRAPEEAETYHPFIYRSLALEIIHEVLCKEPQ